jgi:rhodanese-related sulfurtransferase
MAAKRSSTIGYERRYNAALQTREKSKFVESLTTNMPEVPDHFSRCSEINRKGPELVENLQEPISLDPRDFQKTIERENAVVLDTRCYEAFGGQHIPGAYSIDSSGNLPTFAGWVIPPGKKILLVSESSKQAEDAVIWLRRVGLDNTIAFLNEGMHAWANEGLLTNHVGQLSAEELHTKIIKGERMVLVDVRAQSEFEINHIKGTTNIPAPQLRALYKELDRKKRIILICRTGHRSSLAASLLIQRGFKSVSSVAGGMQGYSAAGYVQECPMCSIPHGPRLLGKSE